MQHCRWFLGKDAGVAFFFECVYNVAFFFCLAKLQNHLLCGGSFQMKSATLQVVLDEGCRVCILLLSAFALLHSSFVLLNCKIGRHVAEVIQMKSATLQVVFEEGCRVCILLLGVFALLHSSFSARRYALCLVF